MSGEAEKIAIALKRYGRTMMLRRRIGSTAAFQDVSVKGISRGFKPDELVGALQQGDRQITISNSELAAQSAFVGPPRKGDFITVDGVNTAVQGSEPKYLGNIILAHVVWVRG